MAEFNSILDANITLASICSNRSNGVQGKIYIGSLKPLFDGKRDVVNPFQITEFGEQATMDFTAGTGEFDGYDLVTIESPNIDIIPTASLVGMAGSNERFEHSVSLRVYGDEALEVRKQINKLAQGRYFIIVVDGEVGENQTLRLYGATSGLTASTGDMNNMNDGEYGDTAVFTFTSSDEYGNEKFYPQLLQAIDGIQTNPAYLSNPVTDFVSQSIAILDGAVIA